MARPDFDFNLTTFTFDNGHVTIVGETDIGPPLTVQSVTLTNPAVDNHETHVLGVADVVVPDHLFGLLTG